MFSAGFPRFILTGLFRAVNFSLGLTPNIRHCERSEAIQKCHDRENWIAAPPPEARNDGMRKV
jgi:hypothetical protein